MRPAAYHAASAADKAGSKATPAQRGRSQPPSHPSLLPHTSDRRPKVHPSPQSLQWLQPNSTDLQEGWHKEDPRPVNWQQLQLNF